MSEHKCKCCSDNSCDINQEHEHSHNHNHGHSHDIKGEKYLLISSAIAYFILLVVDNLYNFSYVTDVLFFVLYLVCGFSVIKSAIKSIMEKDFFNEFTLMFLATAVAIIIKQMPEAVGVMLFYRTGEFLQELATQKSKKSIKELLTSKPEMANLIVGDELKLIKVDEIEVGQTFLVKSGEKIPTDSVILSGFSRVDTSSITGEFMPQTVGEGSEVLGGYINIGTVLVVKAIKRFKDTSIARTMELIESSVKHKAPTEKFISKFARYYTPVVFFVALMVAIFPPLILGLEWSTWIYRALVMLVISCPCALVISIPLSYFASIGVASRKGILVKGGVVIDAAKDVDMVVFDKTGTLTKGQLNISDILPAEGVSKDELISIATSIEQYSNHPISLAIMKKAPKDVKMDSLAAIEDVAGKGLVVKTGKKTYLAGNPLLMKDYRVEFVESEVSGTQVYFAQNGEYKGLIVLNDTIKPEAERAIKELKKRGVKTFMLTGDNQIAAEYVATKLGLDGYKASLLPEEKLIEVEKLRHDNKIMFVGDGVNDAPVLSSVHIGVAMGGLGSKLAVEVSDAVILNDDISKVADLVKLAKNTHVIVWENIIMALGVKTLFMILGVVGLSGLWEAVFADVGVSLLAIFNSLRLARK